MSDEVSFRLSSSFVTLSWDETQELIARLNAQVGTRGAIEAITNRAPVGAVLTHEQKIQVWNVIHDWIAEVGTDGLGSVMALRDGLEADLPEIGRQRGD